MLTDDPTFSMSWVNFFVFREEKPESSRPIAPPAAVFLELQ